MVHAVAFAQGNFVKKEGREIIFEGSIFPSRRKMSDREFPISLSVINPSAHIESLVGKTCFIISYPMQTSDREISLEDGDVIPIKRKIPYAVFEKIHRSVLIETDFFRRSILLNTWAVDEATGSCLTLQRRRGDESWIARCFRANAVNKAFATRDLSQHGLHPASITHILNEEIERKRAERKAQNAERNKPHDFKVGDVIARSWGATMRRVDFFVVTAIPGPRKVEIAPIPCKHHSGDWHSGTIVPVLDSEPDMSQKMTLFTEFVCGEFYICPPGSRSVSGGYERYRRWSGKPEMVYSD